MFNHPPRNLQEALQTAFRRPGSNDSDASAQDATPEIDSSTSSRLEPPHGHTGRHDEQSARRPADPTPPGASGAH